MVGQTKRAGRAASPAGAAPSPGRSAYLQLSEEIINGELPPGTALVEAQLANRLGVSRTPIREALSRLEQEGFVERHDRGLRVRTRSIEEIMEIYEIRVELEAIAARAAARKRSDLDLMLIEKAHRNMCEATASGTGEMVEVNRAFHTALWRAGGNKTLADLLARLNIQLQRYHSTTLSEPGRWDEANREHGELVDAIREQDADRAADIARAHIGRARDLRLAMYLNET